MKRAINILGGFDIRWRQNVPFVWVRLPDGWRPSNFALHCERNGVVIRSADEFALRETNPENAVRISLNANIPIKAYEDALRRIAKLLAEPPFEDPA